MFKNHLKIAFRSIGENKVHSAINIVGLGLGLACCILILLFVRFELGFDKHYANADRIYRISREYFPLEGARARVPASNNAPVGPALLEDFSEIEAVGRFFGGSILLSKDETSFVEPGLRFADNAVFDIFAFDWLAGDPTQALVAPNNIVLTESLALKYFGRLDVLGETMRARDQFDVTVSGVIRDLPANTHVDFSALLSMNILPLAFRPDFLEDWNRNTDYYTYFLLREGADVANIESGIAGFLDRRAGEDASKFSTLPIMSIGDIHLRSRMDEEWPAKAPGNLNTVYTFSAIACAILLIACINFMSIATARSSQRAKEIGMRLSIGASRKELVGQFLGESALTACLAMAVAVVLVEVLLPVFRTFVGAYLDFKLVGDLDVLLSLLGLTIFVALFAGSYPAFYLSAYKPAKVLKGDLTRGKSGQLFRNALVVLQFSIAIALVVSTVVIYQQRQLAANMELGFDKEQIVVLPSGTPGGYGADWSALKDELLQHSAIEEVSVAHYLPFSFNDNQYPVRRRGSAVDTRIQVMMVDYDFFETYGIDLVAGRVFSEDITTDVLKTPTEQDSTFNISYVLNESAVAALGLDRQSFDGEVLEFAGSPIAGPVIGVVADTYFESVRRNVRPIMFLLTPPQAARGPMAMVDASIRIRPESANAALAHIDAVWSRHYPDQENNRYFLDDDFRAMYLAEQKQGELFSWFALLAILIACLGLYGLASFNAERRTKEIGVRKVMGGSVWSIVVLLTNDFSKLVLLSNVIAWPLAYVAMQRWLEQFVYRIDMTPVIFIGSGLIALCIAWVTVGGTAAKAASAKPILALRYE